MLNYISSAEYQAFGLSSLSIDRVDNACAVVDAYLSRPEGLMYSTDVNGFPVYMSRKLPEAVFKLTAPISPGKDVTAQISSGPLLSAGSALVLDRSVAASLETVYVKQVVSVNTVILSEVVHSHDTGTVVEEGMTIDCALHVAKGRAYVTLPSGPIRRLVSAVGRAGYPRRGDTLSNLSPQASGILSSVSMFGGAPIWQIINVQISDIDLEKNQVWTPMGFLMTPYSEVRVSYIAGFPVDNVPMAIKRATASIAKAINESPASASVSVFKAGEVQMERFVDSVIDSDLRMMLAPYRASIYA